MRCHLCAIAFGLQLLLNGSTSAEEGSSTPCERLVEFRDGSILRLELPSDYQFAFRKTTTSSSNGQPTPLSLKAPIAIRFSRLPALAQLGSIQAAILQLDSETFAIRERALRVLVSGGIGFRPFLTDHFLEKRSPEARWRLARAISALPEQVGMHEHAYDEVVAEGGAVVKGDLDSWQLTANYRSKTIQLNRNTVRAIRQAPKLVARGITPIIATTEPIRKDLDVLFPPDCVRIDFEHDSNGDPIRPSQNISRRFVIDGLVLDTSIKDSYVSVNDFSVDSRSGGQSAATHDPPFQGVLTLTFCVPGNAQEPAGVTHIGVYVGVVQPGGTSLIAYDASGHRIAAVTTESGPHEFLGLHSNVPIHRVEIVPNEAVDDDVTIDDIVFPIPTAIDASGSQQHLSLDFDTGERLACANFEVNGDTITASPAGMFSDALTFPIAQLVRFRTPAELLAPPADNGRFTSFWLMLEDGSTLQATTNAEDRPPTTQLSSLDIEMLAPVAVWADDNQLIPLPPGTRLEDGQLATILTKAPTLQRDAKFTAEQFTANSGDATSEWSYNRLPTVWLKNPNREKEQRATGFMRLNTGERIVFGSDTTFRLVSFDSELVHFTCGEIEIALASDAISTLRLPKAD